MFLGLDLYPQRLCNNTTASLKCQKRGNHNYYLKTWKLFDYFFKIIFCIFYFIFFKIIYYFIYLLFDFFFSQQTSPRTFDGQAMGFVVLGGGFRTSHLGGYFCNLFSVFSMFFMFVMLFIFERLRFVLFFVSQRFRLLGTLLSYLTFCQVFIFDRRCYIPKAIQRYWRCGL